MRVEELLNLEQVQKSWFQHLRQEAPCWKINAQRWKYGGKRKVTLFYCYFGPLSIYAISAGIVHFKLATSCTSLLQKSANIWKGSFICSR